MFHAEVNGARLYYQFDGSSSAPVVVLSNSLGTNLRMWDAQIPALTEKFRVLRYDSRGHGDSTVTPGPYTFEMLGNGLIACNTAAKIGNPEFWNKRIETVRSGGMAAIAGTQALRWFTPAYVAKFPEVIETMTQGLLSTPADGYIATCEALRENDLRESVSKIRIRTLVIVGSYDGVTPPADGKFIAAQIPRSQYVELNAAHLSNIEDSAAFSSTVLQFLSYKESR